MPKRARLDPINRSEEGSGVSTGGGGGTERSRFSCDSPVNPAVTDQRYSFGVLLPGSDELFFTMFGGTRKSTESCQVTVMLREVFAISSRLAKLTRLRMSSPEADPVPTYELEPRLEVTEIV